MVQTDLCSINKQKNASVQASCVNQKDEMVQTGPINTKDSSAQYDKSLQFRNLSTQTDASFSAGTLRSRWPETEVDDLPDMDFMVASKPREDPLKDLDMPLTQDFLEELIDDTEEDFVCTKTPVSKPKRSGEGPRNPLLKPLAKMMDDGYFLNKNLLYAKPDSSGKNRASLEASSSKDPKGKLRSHA